MFKKTLHSKIEPKILILEDDVDQMAMLIDSVLSEIKNIIDDKNTNDKFRQELESIQILEVDNINTLQKTVAKHKGILLAVLDCNTPDVEGGASHDQLVKTNHGIITGQHKAVDLVTKHLPDVPITIVSSMDRFQRTVSKHYASSEDLNINFVRKKDAEGLKANIRYHLKEYLATVA